MDIQHRYIWESVEVGDVDVQYISTHIEQVDILKKPLSQIRFQGGNDGDNFQRRNR
jgi:hypothetical protein